jgi:hypothetical protein
MGTKSNTIFYDGKSRIANMYRQYDGYPQGHGLDKFITFCKKER